MMVIRSGHGAGAVGEAGGRRRHLGARQAGGGQVAGRHAAGRHAHPRRRGGVRAQPPAAGGGQGVPGGRTRVHAPQRRLLIIAALMRDRNAHEQQ